MKNLRAISLALSSVLCLLLSYVVVDKTTKQVVRCRNKATKADVQKTVSQEVLELHWERHAGLYTVDEVGKRTQVIYDKASKTFKAVKP